MTHRGNAFIAGAAGLLLLATAACGSGDDRKDESPGSSSPAGSTAPTPCSSPTSGGIGQCGPGGAKSSDGAAKPSGGDASASSAATPGTLHIGGSGDILVHVPVRENAQKNAHGNGYDFKPMFQDVKSRIGSLDLALCHLETPLSKDNTNLSIPGILVFNVPHEAADALKWAGFAGCDRVGNHVLDRGTKGIESTKEVLDAAGLKQQGPAPSSVNGQDAVVYDVKGVKVGHLAYAYTTLNRGSSSTELPQGMPWFQYWQFPIVKAEGIIADAKRAKAAGAQYVVVSMHWGQEYSSQASPEQRQLAKKLLESPEVDLILGTHVHVAQPCEKVNGKYVLYGMGNFLSNQGPASASSLKPATQDGMIVDVAITRGEDGKVTQQLTYQPTHVRLSDHRIQLATPTQNPEAYKRVVWAMSQLGGQCDAKPAA